MSQIPGTSSFAAPEGLMENAMMAVQMMVLYSTPKPSGKYPKWLGLEWVVLPEHVQTASIIFALKNVEGNSDSPALFPGNLGAVGEGLRGPCQCWLLVLVTKPTQPLTGLS